MKLPTFEDIEGLTPKALEAKEFILNAIFKALGEFITAAEIARKLRLEESIQIEQVSVRAVIAYMRLFEGQPISSSGDGFRYEYTPEGLNSTIEHIRGRIIRMSRVVHALEMTQTRMRCHQNQQIRMF